MHYYTSVDDTRLALVTREIPLFNKLPDVHGSIQEGDTQALAGFAALSRLVTPAEISALALPAFLGVLIVKLGSDVVSCFC